MKRVRSLGFSLVVISALSIGFNGCTSLYSNASLKNISSHADAKKEIKNGMSMAEVENKWGRPNNKHSYDNKTTWMYSEAKSSEQTFNNVFMQGLTGRAKMDVKMVSIEFDPMGKVADIHYAEQTQ